MNQQECNTHFGRHLTGVRFFFVRMTFIQSPVVLMLAGNRLCGYWCLFLVKFAENLPLCNPQPQDSPPGAGEWFG